MKKNIKEKNLFSHWRGFWFLYLSMLTSFTGINYFDMCGVLGNITIVITGFCALGGLLSIMTYYSEYDY